MILGCGKLVPARGDVTDPVGYTTLEAVPGEQRVLPLGLYRMDGIRVPVSAVSGNVISLAWAVSEENVSRLGSCFLQVREGLREGVSMRVAAISGASLTTRFDPMGMIQAGDMLEVISERTVGGIMSRATQAEINWGTDPENSDLIGIWNPQLQETTTLFAKEGVGWVDAEDAAAGDRSATVVPHPCPLLYTRRGDEILSFLVVGAVPMPSRQRYFRVWTGRNFLSMGVNPLEGSVADYFQSAGVFDIQSGRSAPASDVIRIHDWQSGVSPFFYRASSSGSGFEWREIGQSGPASAYPVELFEALEFHRRGVSKFVRFEGFTIPTSLGPAASTPLARSSAPAGVEGAELIDVKSRDSGIRVEWYSEPGVAYRVQWSAASYRGWEDWSPTVTAEGERCWVDCERRPGGLIRIIEETES
ncbi:hypothetical protein [Haloferula sp. A504]|uniref:hypothetical protein n=1 Tax=Haloferula sp. A504 TaxID=3373601 RepID=UPI0031C57EDD|nr:hypothetical protein [Verrucomicrobiaceae bacterium E54]